MSTKPYTSDYRYGQIHLTKDFLTIGEEVIQTRSILNVNTFISVTSKKKYWAFFLIAIGLLTSIFIVGIFFLMWGLYLYSVSRKYYLQILLKGSAPMFIQLSSKRIMRKVERNFTIRLQHFRQEEESRNIQLNNALVINFSSEFDEKLTKQIEIIFPTNYSSQSTPSDFFDYSLDFVELALGRIKVYDIKINIDKWFKNENDYVHANEPIFSFTLFVGNYSYHIEKKLIKYAEVSGVLHIPIHVSNQFYHTHNLYTIYKDEKTKLELLFINTPNLTVNPSTRDVIIKWSSVCSIIGLNGIHTWSEKDRLDLIFSFNYFEGSDFIVFTYNPKQLKLFPGVVFSFTFSNNQSLDLVIDSDSYKSLNYLQDGFYESKIKIFGNELRLFIDYDLDNWSIFFPAQSHTIKGIDFNPSYYFTIKDFQKAIRKFALDYFSIVNKKVKDYSVPLSRPESIHNEYIDVSNCSVYLMIDQNTRFHKIGISNSPQHREKTLQSEKPTIELLASKRFPARKIAESFEKALHVAYKEKRIRGEWFDLDDVEVNQIIEALQ